MGSNEDEYSFSAGPNKSSKATTNTLYDCPTRAAALSRAEQGAAQWRYWYTGNYSNISPLPFLGAYHAAEIPMVWGTSSYAGLDSPNQAEMSSYITAAWVAFANDPINGLSEYGWPRYNESKPTLVQLGAKNSKQAISINHLIADYAC